MTDLAPPHDDHAERALLGAMLLDPAATTTAEHHLGIGDMYRPDHTSIYTAIVARASLGQPVDEILIAADLARTGTLKKLPGGASYLHTCIEACPDPSHAGHYARLIAEHATSRRLLTLAAELGKAAGIDDPKRREHLVSDVRTQLEHTLAAVHERNNGTRLRLTPASAYTIRPVRWVWEDRMPVGEITLIPGREGVGKSTFLAWMAAAITNGNLPGVYHGQPRAVLYAANEDAWEYTISPRLKVAGADMDLVLHVEAITQAGPTKLMLPRDCDAIPDSARKAGAVALMCDPLMSLLDDRISAFRAQELRSALEPLRRAAEVAGLVVPALVHFNKGQGADINTLIAGSRAFTEVARAVVAAVEDRDADDYTVIVSQAKNNLGRLNLPNLAYTIDDVILETAEGPGNWGRLRWLGEVDVSAEDLLTGDASDRALSAKTLAVIEWVEAHDPHTVTAQEVKDHFSGGDTKDTGDTRDKIGKDHVQKILTRCVKRGDLVSPARGEYKAANKGKGGKKRAANSPYTQNPVPTVPTVLSGGGGVYTGDGSVSPDVSPVSQGHQGQTGQGTVIARGGTRARETEPGALIACSVCHSPLHDVFGLGHHPLCTPTGANAPDPRPPDPPTAPWTGDETPERERYP